MYDEQLPNLRHLRLIAHVLEGRSLREAARRMSVTQPAASLCLAAMEKLYGVSLFERTNNGLVPTACGEILRRRAERCWGILGRALADLYEPSGGEVSPAKVMSRITISHLKVMGAVLEHENFKLAAEQLGVQQPSVQRSIAQLEQVLGTPLVRRYRGNGELNHTGRQIAIAAALALVELTVVPVEIRELIGDLTGSVIVGTVRVTAANVVPEAILSVTRTVPRARFRVHQDGFERMLDALRVGRLDYFCSTLRGELPQDLIGEVLGLTNLRILCGPDHPLAKAKDVKIDDLAKCSWVGPPRATGAAMRFRGIFESEGAPVPFFTVETASFEAVRPLLLSGRFLGFTAATDSPSEKSLEGLHLIEWPTPDAQRSYWLLRRRDWQPTQLQKLFARAITEASARAS